MQEYDEKYGESADTATQNGQTPLTSSQLNRFGERTDDACHPQVCHPWRRYFARMLDLAIYGIFVDVAKGYLFGVNLTAQGHLTTIASTCLALLLMFAIEPLLLSHFGTTLGKAVFGLRIQNLYGRNMTYSVALERLGGMFWHGMGCNIPFYNAYRQYKSYQSCAQGELLPWDGDTAYTIADTRTWRTFVFIGAHLVLFLLSLALMFGQLYPPNRGDLTVAEFSENFNYYCDYYDFNAYGYTMAEDGSWHETPSDGVTIYMFEEDSVPTFNFLCDEAGIIQEIQITALAENREFTAPDYQSYQLLGGLAVLDAHSNLPVLTNRQYAMALEAALNQSTTFSAEGVSISWDIAHEGYIVGDYAEYLFVDDAKPENSYSLTGVIALD